MQSFTYEKSKAALVFSDEISSACSDPQSTDVRLLEKLKGTAEKVPAMKDIIKSAKEKFTLRSVRASGPLKNFNPTNVQLRIVRSNDSDDPFGRTSSESQASDLALLWRSRDNRKGRRSIAIPAEDLKSEKNGRRYVPRFTSSTREVAKGLWRCCSTFPYWDMSWWVGFWFTFGSLIFVVNGFFAWVPIAWPDTEFPGEGKYAVGLTTFFGVLAFQVGVTLEYLEAVNDGSWHGSMMRRLIDGHEGMDDKTALDNTLRGWVNYMHPFRSSKDQEKRSDPEKVVDFDPEAGWRDFCANQQQMQHNYRERKLSVYQERRGAVDMGGEQEGSSHELHTFRWWPTWKNLKEHHIYEIGFLGSTAQFIGGTIFIVTGVVAVPDILEDLKPWQENMAYWMPQMVASVGFILGSWLFMIETQERWWKPQPFVLGWHVGFWALIGSIGFELCAALGPATYKNHGANYQCNLASLWGSICFLISSMLQWYEAVNKNPIEELFDEPGEMKSWQVHPI